MTGRIGLVLTAAWFAWTGPARAVTGDLWVNFHGNADDTGADTNSRENTNYAGPPTARALLWSHAGVYWGNATPTPFVQETSPAVAYGRVYHGGLDDNVYAWNASTGALVWTHTTGGEI